MTWHTVQEWLEIKIYCLWLFSTFHIHTWWGQAKYVRKFEISRANFEIFQKFSVKIKIFLHILIVPIMYECRKLKKAIGNKILFPVILEQCVGKVSFVRSLWWGLFCEDCFLMFVFWGLFWGLFSKIFFYKVYFTRSILRGLFCKDSLARSLLKGLSWKVFCMVFCW